MSGWREPELLLDEEIAARNGVGNRRRELQGSASASGDHAGNVAQAWCGSRDLTARLRNSRSRLGRVTTLVDNKKTRPGKEAFFVFLALAGLRLCRLRPAGCGRSFFARPGPRMSAHLGWTKGH